MFGNDSTLQIVIKAVDQATGVFRSVRNSLDETERRFERSANASRTFALGLGAAAVAVGGLGFAAIKAAGDMEQTRIAFETMLGSAEKADEFVKQLVSFAKTTPFELTGLNTAAKQLLAYGFAQEEVIPNLKALGDIASGVGMDKLPNLILAFGQVKAATKLTGMELRQFTEAGVPLLGMLAEQMGKPVSAIQEMVSEGKIGFAEVETALKALTGEGGRFNDLMDKQSKSLGGMVSNLQDSWNLFLAGEGAKLLDWGKAFVQLAQVIITDVLPVWIDRIDALIQFFKEHQTAIYIVAGAIVGALTPAIIAAGLAFAALAITLAPWIIGGAIIGGLVAGMVWVAKNWDTIWGGIKSGFAAAVNFLIGIAEGWANSWVQAANVIIDALNRVKFSIPSWVPGIGGKSFGINIPRVEPVKLPRMEHGGIVPGPVGAAVPIMAHGQETVLPAGRSRSGGDTYSVVINNPQVRDRADVDYLRTQIEAALRDVTRGHKLATI
jgi:tape measure domain-containing protein